MNRVRNFFTDDRYVGAVILLNAVVLFILAFDSVHQDPSLVLTLELVDIGFIFYFILEAIFKINRDGWKAYIANGWNRFDFFIVLLSIPSIILLFDTSMNDLSFLFVLRIVRVIRFFRFMRFIPNVDSLFSGIARAFRASIFVFVALFIYTFTISLITCKLFRHATPQAAEYFGDPVTSFYSIFKIFTIEGWYEIPDSIVEGTSPVFKFFTILYFIVIVVSGGLFGLSIVNAIFVDEMVKDNNDELVEQVKALDKKLDALIAQNARLNPANFSEEKSVTTQVKIDYDVGSSLNKE